MVRHSIVCYNSYMANTLLIGKDLPDCLDFTQALATTGRAVFCAAKADANATSFESENIYSSTWNKSSAISAHSLLIQAETKLNTIDEVIFYFDTSYFCQQFELDKTEEITAAVDTMINGYLYSINELVKRADQRKEKMTVAFLVKEYPSKFDITTNSSKNPNMLPAASIVSCAEASFISLAQNFVSNMIDRDFLSVILAKCQTTNELYKNERGIASWCTEAFDSVRGLKNRISVKQAANWNKVGSKVQTGFLFFK